MAEKSGISEFIRSNVFSLINLVVVIGGLSYYSGEMQSTLSAQNRAIRQIQTQIGGLQASASSGTQNTSDIARLRAETDTVQQKLDGISDQLSRLSQWVKDHKVAVK